MESLEDSELPLVGTKALRPEVKKGGGFPAAIDSAANRSARREFSTYFGAGHDEVEAMPKEVSEAEDELIPAIRKVLEGLGVVLDRDEVALGRRSSQRAFDITGKYGSFTIAIDLLVAAQNIAEEDLLLEFSKFVDVQPTVPILVVMPSLSSSLRKVAEGFRVSIVDADDARGLLEGLRRYLELVLPATPPTQGKEGSNPDRAG